MRWAARVEAGNASTARRRRSRQPVAYYAKEGGTALGERMFDAALAALKQVERMPAMGSPRLGQLCEVAHLRSWRVAGFPMQWFYFERDDSLDVIRLLGDRQDIAGILDTSD